MVFICRARGIKSIFRPGTYRRESDSRASRHVPNQLRSRLNAFARALAHVRADLASARVGSCLETRVSSMHDGSIPIDRGPAAARCAAGLIARGRKLCVASEGGFSRRPSGSDLYPRAIKITLGDLPAFARAYFPLLPPSRADFPAARRRKLQALYTIARFMANS